MPLPYARSIAEAHLYMELHPCECGAAGKTGYTHAAAQSDQGLVDDHAFSCAGCGRRRRFVFRLPGLAPQHADKYGGPEPSQIVDAMEWRLVSLAAMAEAGEQQEPGRRRGSLETALGAYQEMLKFIPPGQDTVPDSAFFTERGRRMRLKEPAYSFGRHFIETMVDGIREDLAAVR